MVEFTLRETENNVVILRGGEKIRLVLWKYQSGRRCTLGKGRTQLRGTSQVVTEATEMRDKGRRSGSGEKQVNLVNTKKENAAGLRGSDIRGREGALKRGAGLVSMGPWTLPSGSLKFISAELTARQAFKKQQQNKTAQHDFFESTWIASYSDALLLPSCLKSCMSLLTALGGRDRISSVPLRLVSYQQSPAPLSDQGFIHPVNVL